MITKEQALQLKRGDVLHMEGKGHGMRWRVNGQVKTWKRDPSRFMVPLKFGLYGYDYLTELNAPQMHLASECPVESLRE